MGEGVCEQVGGVGRLEGEYEEIDVGGGKKFSTLRSVEIIWSL